MHSVRTEDGAVMELGPRSVRTAGTAGKATLSLVSSALLASLVPRSIQACTTLSFPLSPWLTVVCADQ